MQKRTIANFYITSIILGIVGLFLLLSGFTHLLPIGYLLPMRVPGMIMIVPILGALFFLIAFIFGMIAWVSVLINFSRAHAWTWFVLTFFFGGIMLLIYLIGGPEPLAAGQPSQQQLGALPLHPSPVVSSQSPQSISALEILQQRYARGEIDTATFQQMRAQLEGSHR
ncbi:MAG: SHOCT domain-containing protein [Ktedonobacteraceae bacterium]|nr:SHOCT domain-containing protein [Ktedonobacteraceae bacterium]MBO0795556.1 SHOCT domain-containing protein [Ktedonobacteraceae bacterium]